MSDIFHEVDEEVRREQLQKLWDQYGPYFIALAVLVVAGVAAWRGYDYWQSKKAAEFGAQFNAAAILSEQGKHDEAEKEFARIATQGTSGYRVLARMREAAEIAERDPKAAITAYDDLAASAATGQPLQDLAALRAGMILVDSAPLAEITRRLEPLAGTGAPFRHSARELLAFAAWKAGDAAAMRKWYQLVREDAEIAVRAAQPRGRADGADGRKREGLRRIPMRVVRGIILTLLLASLGGALAGCESLENLQFWDTKKKLPGDRKPVFPEGVPGVTQGIPPELMKGYQEPQQQDDPAAAAAQASAEKVAPKPEPKPKPKPRKVAQPRPAPAAQQPQQQQPPQQTPAPWPGQQPQAQQQQPAWPTAR